MDAKATEQFIRSAVNAHRQHELRDRIMRFKEEVVANGGKFRDKSHRDEWNRVSAEYEELKGSGNRLPGMYNRGELENEPATEYFRQMNNALTDERTMDHAISGWTRGQMGQPIGSGEVEACNAYGISPLSPVFVARAERHAPMTGLQRLAAIRSAEARAQSGLTAVGGGATIPTGFQSSLEIAMLNASGMLQASEIWRTQDGRETPWPTTDDTDNEGILLGESQESTEQDVSFAARIFRNYKISSKLIKVPHELMRDSAFNLASVLGTLLGQRIGRKLNRVATVGVGPGSPEGIITAATLGKTTASATAITMDELIDLQHSVDVAYRTAEDGFGWMMHDSVAAYIRKLKDGDGNYLWQRSVLLGVPDSLLGWPVFINNHMASSIATGEKTVLCGAFRKYKIRLVAEQRIRRLVERYAEFDQEGLLAFQEMDSGLLDAGTNPVKYLLQA